MIIRKEDVLAVCRVVAPKYELDPLLVFAVCLQEGQKTAAGDYDPSVARLEQNYYRRYVERGDRATTTEVLLSASYGVMQMMGLSLLELGYFQWYFEQSAVGVQAVLKNPLSQFAVPSALDAYCDDLGWMVEWGTRHLAKKRKAAAGDTGRMLDLWNGDLTGKYRTEVMEKYNKLKAGG